MRCVTSFSARLGRTAAVERDPAASAAGAGIRAHGRELFVAVFAATRLVASLSAKLLLALDLVRKKASLRAEAKQARIPVILVDRSIAFLARRVGDPAQVAGAGRTDARVQAPVRSRGCTPYAVDGFTGLEGALAAVTRGGHVTAAYLRNVVPQVAFCYADCVVARPALVDCAALASTSLRPTIET
jgi:hypothetical protein